MRVLRLLLRTLLVIFLLAAGGATAVVVVSQTAWFRNWLRGYIVAEARDYLNGSLSIDRLDGNLFSGVQLSGLSIEMDGRPVVHVDEIGLTYSLYHIATTGVAIDELRLTRPTISIERDAEGLLLARLIKKQAQEADREGPLRPFDVNAIVIQDGTLDLGGIASPNGVTLPKRIKHLDSALEFHYEPVRYSVEVARLSFRGAEPAIGLNAFSGGFAIKDDTFFIDRLAMRFEETALSVNGAIEHYLTTPQVKLNASSDKVSLPEFAAIVPALDGIALQPGFTLALDGALDRLQIDLAAQSSAGGATARLVTDLVSPGQSAKGEVAITSLNLAGLANDASLASNLTARAAIDLQAEAFDDLNSLRGHVELEGSRLEAAGYRLDALTAKADLNGRQVSVDANASGYGAQLTSKGRLTIPEPGESLTYDVAGAARHIDLRQMPRTLNVPRVATNINAAYHAAGAQAFGNATRPAATEISAEFTFAATEAPGLRLDAGSTAAISLQGEHLSYRADATVRDVNLRQIGEAFAVPALTDARFESALAGHIAVDGRGKNLSELAASASGTISNSTIAGAVVSSLDFSADVAEQVAHVIAAGRVAAIDPGALSGKEELRGQIAGVLTADATLTQIASGVTPDNASGHAEVTLEPSAVGDLAIQSGYLNADYRAQVASVNYLDITGTDLHLNATGAVALDDEGQSNLVVHADSPRLAEIGRLVDQPLEGIGAIDAKVTGNRSDLRIAGTLQADGIKYQDNGALALNVDYTVRVPDLQFVDAHVDATASGTFVTVAGQNINEVEVKGAYEQKHLTFDATARQPERTLAAAGDLLMHPDHQEVHLQRLALTTANQQWEVAPGQAPTIRYAADAVEVRDLTLVSGDQQVTADGTFGRDGEDLTVGLNNIDVAAVNALLLRPPQFTGRLNGTAEVSGTKAAPQVKGKFRVANGAFRQFTYDSLGGTVDYSSDGVALDVRLDQNATQWITAKGHLPANLMAPRENAAGEREDGGHVEPLTAADRVDLTIDSSPLGLGMIQGFTTQVTDVAGTVEAHVRVTGSAADPHPEGRIVVADGAMTVVPTGVSYSHIAGQVDLQADRVHIDQITVLDNHFSALSITGDLAVHQREVRAGQLWVNAEDFKVVDNKLGNVRVQSAIELAGTLRSPRIQGDFSITTGRVDLDEIFALAGPSVYATTAIAAPNGEEPQASASLFDGLRMDLRLSVPNDLVVKASSLQPPGATLSLGALNVTLGGDLTAQKDRLGPMRLVGAINTVRGTYDFQGRRFTILRDGTVRFEGEEITNPRLDIRTMRTIQGVEARVDVRGRLKEPEIAMSSTPPLDQADILALIVFNQPINQLGEGDQINLAQRAQALATGAVAGQLAQSIGQAFNLDTFEIDVAPETGSAAQLTFGQQLGRNLYLKVEQGLGNDAMTNLIMEYELNRFFRLQTNFLQGSSGQQSLFQRRQGSGADLIILFQK